MRTKIAIIDPFIVTPAVASANHLTNYFHLKSTYHMPHLSELKTLKGDDSDGYIILGSASHVTKPLTWHSPLADFLMEKLAKGKPMLGICFGHQFLGHLLGSTVNYFQDENYKFTGVRRIIIQKDFADLKKGDEFLLSVSHKQVIQNLSPEFEEIGVGLPNDIIVHKKYPFWGTQAHPETGPSFFSHSGNSPTLNEEQESKASGLKFIRHFLKGHDLIP